MGFYCQCQPLPAGKGNVHAQAGPLWASRGCFCNGEPRNVDGSFLRLFYLCSSESCLLGLSIVSLHDLLSRQNKTKTHSGGTVAGTPWKDLVAAGRTRTLRTSRPLGGPRGAAGRDKYLTQHHQIPQPNHVHSGVPEAAELNRETLTGSAMNK